VKRVIIKFKESAQNEENNTCIAIITGKSFMSQLFSYILNIENYLQSKIKFQTSYFQRNNNIF